MDNFPIKSFILKGNLNVLKSNLTYNLLNVQSVSLKKNLWELCIKDVAFENKTNANISQFVHIHCNLVHDLRLQEFKTQNYLPSIASVLFKATNREKKIVYFEKTWFEVNTPNDEIRLIFRDAMNETDILTNCDVVVTVLMRQKQ
jgi:hypothetical protein